LVELDRSAIGAAARNEPTPTREAARPLSGPASDARPDETARVAKLVRTILYVPTTDLEARFGTDTKPLADYINAL
jgi:hypothetical protein